MTPREKNLWGLIVGLVLAVSLGVYKASHSEIAAPADAPAVETSDAEVKPPDELNGSDVGMYGEDDADVNATDVMAANPFNEGEYPDAGEISPPQNLLPENATDAAAVEPPIQRVVDQPDGGEE